MGLIKAAVGALTGTLGDTWKEAIHCPVIGNDTVVVNGEKMHNGNARSSNTKGTDNVISNGSAIMVEENTCMLTLDNGKITNVVTEPGRYILDNSTAPSIFAGQIKDSLKDLYFKIHIRRNTCHRAESNLHQPSETARNPLSVQEHPFPIPIPVIIQQ